MIKTLRKWLCGSIIIALLVASTYSPVKAATGINDLDSASDYARASIERLVTKGVILGDDNGNFNPNVTVTRAEMVTMVVKALNLETTDIPSTATFKDVPKKYWAFKYVEVAYKAGVINGVGDGYFDPNEKCTREQLAVIFIKAMGIKESGIVGKQPLYIIRQLKDKEKISPWAADFIEFAMDSGILKGTGGWNFGPDQKAPREQIAVLIDRILENKEDILNFHKCYSGNIQYPELFNAFRNNKFNFMGRITGESSFTIFNNSITGDISSNEVVRLKGYANLHDNQFEMEIRKTIPNNETSIERYYSWQIGDKTYTTNDTSDNTQWTVKTNEEIGRGEDFEVAKAGKSSFYNLFTNYPITKKYFYGGGRTFTNYSITFTYEKLDSFAEDILNELSIVSIYDNYDKNIFNKGFTITVYLDLIDTGDLINEIHIINSINDSVTYRVHGGTMYTEIGKDFEMTPP